MRFLSGVQITIVLAALMLCLVMTPNAVYATYMQLQPPIADSYLRENVPDTSNGAYTYLNVYVSGSTLLSEIPPGSTVNEAYLLLYYYEELGGNPSGRTYNSYRVTKDWIEAEATWNSYMTGSLWDTAGGDYTTSGGASANVPASPGQDMVWDVTNIVKAWIEDGQPNYGFLLKDSGEIALAEGVGAYFYSKESTVGDSPRLKVDWTTPEPVGGLVMPTNKLEILTPYLALAGLVAVVSAVAVVKRRSKD